MDEGLVNETQSDWAESEEAQSYGDGKLDSEALRRLRLNDFLRELVRVEGRMEAAEMLGVNYKTLVRAEESGQITGRMGDALERLLLSQDSPDEQLDLERLSEIEKRVAALEAGLQSLAKEMRGGRENVRDEVVGRRTEEGCDRETVDRTLQGSEPTGVETGPPGAERQHPSKPFAERRLDPELVTEKSAGDDPQVYGTAWPLVEEWRRIRARHSNEGTSLSWLTEEERLLTLELAMLEEHGLTLPPETQPLKGFARRGQISWRRTALDDTRRALIKRRLLRWLRRVLTLRLWWQ